MDEPIRLPEREPTLNDLLGNLAEAVNDYRASVTKMQDWVQFQTEELWRDQAALRDEVHESVTALSNRIEANRGT